VELVLRVNGHPASSQGWRQVLAAAGGDTRISVIAGTLNRAEALALVQNAHCLLSPHRAEGFGRNIAEAIALGVKVLANGYSGPADFLQRSQRIAFRRCAVRPGAYPFADGLHWSQIIIADLATKMRRLRLAGRRPAAAQLHTPKQAGARYAAALAATQPPA